MLHTLVSVRRSKISIFPARLPKPAKAIIRPWGLKEMKLCGEAPKSWRERTRWSNNTVLAGISVYGRQKIRFVKRPSIGTHTHKRHQIPLN